MAPSPIARASDPPEAPGQVEAQQLLDSGFKGYTFFLTVSVENLIVFLHIFMVLSLPFFAWLYGGSLVILSASFVIFIPLAFVYKPNWMFANTFIVSFVVLFSLPISISTAFLIVLYKLDPTIVSTSFFGFFYLGSIPIASILVFIAAYKMKKLVFLNLVRVSLKFNNCFYILILFILIFITNTINEASDFHQLFPILSEEALRGNNMSEIREAFAFFLQLASFPFLFANAILGAVVEHIVAKCNE